MILWHEVLLINESWKTTFLLEKDQLSTPEVSVEEFVSQNHMDSRHLSEDLEEKTNSQVLDLFEVKGERQ